MPICARLRLLRQVGEQMRAESDAVLGETEIEWHHRVRAVIDDDPTSTRVKPGYHEAVAAALRLVIKETFDSHVTDTSRKTLIPERWAPGRGSLGYAGSSEPSRAEVGRY